MTFYHKKPWNKVQLSRVCIKKDYVQLNEVEQNLNLNFICKFLVPVQQYTNLNEQVSIVHISSCDNLECKVIFIDGLSEHLYLRNWK